VLEEVQGSRKEPFKVRWVRLPFILRPDRRGQELWRDVLTKKYSASWTVDFEARMKAAGAELGIFFDFGGSVGNSLDSLRLIHWASLHYETQQETLIHCLSRNHFEKRLSVGEHANLLQGNANSSSRLLLITQ
jgi:predicted DsbA family dithiol-disulfide isomerase